MNTLAVICGVFGLIAYFFYFIIAKSNAGNDGQGVNLDSITYDSTETTCAQSQKGRWD